MAYYGRDSFGMPQQYYYPGVGIADPMRNTIGANLTLSGDGPRYVRGYDSRSMVQTKHGRVPCGVRITKQKLGKPTSMQTYQECHDLPFGGQSCRKVQVRDRPVKKSQVQVYDCDKDDVTINNGYDSTELYDWNGNVQRVLRPRNTTFSTVTGNPKKLGEKITARDSYDLSRKIANLSDESEKARAKEQDAESSSEEDDDSSSSDSDSSSSDEDEADKVKKSKAKSKSKSKSKAKSTSAKKSATKKASARKSPIKSASKRAGGASTAVVKGIKRTAVKGVKRTAGKGVKRTASKRTAGNETKSIVAATQSVTTKAPINAGVVGGANNGGTVNGGAHWKTVGNGYPSIGYPDGATVTQVKVGKEHVRGTTAIGLIGMDNNNPLAVQRTAAYIDENGIWNSNPYGSSLYGTTITTSSPNSVIYPADTIYRSQTPIEHIYPRNNSLEMPYSPYSAYPYSYSTSAIRVVRPVPFSYKSFPISRLDALSPWKQYANWLKENFPKDHFTDDDQKNIAMLESYFASHPAINRGTPPSSIGMFVPPLTIRSKGKSEEAKDKAKKILGQFLGSIYEAIGFEEKKSGGGAGVRSAKVAARTNTNKTTKATKARLGGTKTAGGSKIPLRDFNWATAQSIEFVDACCCVALASLQMVDGKIFNVCQDEKILQGLVEVIGAGFLSDDLNRYISTYRRQFTTYTDTLIPLTASSASYGSLYYGNSNTQYSNPFIYASRKFGGKNDTKPDTVPTTTTKKTTPSTQN